MKAKIGQKVYDTSKATEVGSASEGYFGDPRGFEEKLYLKDSKEFFLHVIGGSESQYAEEKIIPLNIEDSASWLERVTGADYTASVMSVFEKPAAVKTKAVKAPAVKAAASKAVKPAAEKAAAQKTVKSAGEKGAKTAVKKSAEEKPANPGKSAATKAVKPSSGKKA